MPELKHMIVLYNSATARALSEHALLSIPQIIDYTS